MNATYPFCYKLRAYYTLQIHAYLSVGICIVGITCNLLNILTLSRRKMTSPVNTILLILASIDLVYLLGFIPFAYSSHMVDTCQVHSIGNTSGWILYRSLYMIISPIMLGMSIWLTILLTLYRYMAIVYPFKSGIWNSTKKTYMVAISICLTNIVLLTPALVNSPIHLLNIEVNANGRIMNYQATYSVFKNDVKIQYWCDFYSAIVYIIPSFLQIFLISG